MNVETPSVCLSPFSALGNELHVRCVLFFSSHNHKELLDAYTHACRIIHAYMIVYMLKIVM